MMLAARDNKLHILEKLVELGQNIHHSANVSFKNKLILLEVY